MNKKISLFVLIILALSLFGSSSKPVNAVSWWNNNWSYKMKLTINETKIDADLMDFPVLVYLNSSRIDWAHVQDDLDDLRFIDSTETIQLYAELENYTINDEAWIWVKIPTIDDAVDTDFYLYYGNNVCSSYWNPEDVWETSAVMVQHMVDNPDNAHITDSTQYDNDGTKKGANEPIETASGKIDSAQEFNVDYVLSTTIMGFGTGNALLSSWVKGGDQGGGEHIVARWDTLNTPRSFLGLLAIGTMIKGELYDSTKGYKWTNYIVIGDNNWHFLTVKRNGDNLILYVDGIERTSITGCSTYQLYNAELILGRYREASSGYYSGVIDEVRVYNEAKSAGWIKADYNSGADTLLIYGAEELCLLALTILYNTGINKLYINGTERANNTTIYVDKNVNVNATVIVKPNFIFMKYALGSTGASLIPTYIFNMTNPFTLWSYATPNFFIYEEPTTFTFTHWLILLFIALVISLLAAIKFHIIATVSLILVLYMVINVASYTGIILLAIIVWLLTIMFSIIAFAEI